ncbi:hypothetical protein AB0L06_00735 [Spirillospora sp. NPDC052269]
MANLAGQLFDFASKSNTEVKSVAFALERLVGEAGHWRGRAAGNFRYSFGADVILMNGLAHVAAGIAQLMDQLAADLATLELQVEERISVLIGLGYVQFSKTSLGDDGLRIFAQHLKNADSTVLTELGIREGAADARATGAFLEGIPDIAEKLRKTALAEVTGATQKLMGSLNLYTDSSGKLLSLEPHLLRDPKDPKTGVRDPNGQMGLDQKGNDAIKKAFDDLNESSGINQNDIKEAYKHLQKLGGDADTIGDLMGEYKQFHTAGGAGRLKTLTKTINTVGPILGDIATIVRYLPK